MLANLVIRYVILSSGLKSYTGGSSFHPVLKDLPEKANRESQLILIISLVAIHVEMIIQIFSHGVV